MFFIGSDISLAHAGVTILNENGDLLQWFYLTPIKKYIFDVHERCLYTQLGPKIKKDEDKISFHNRRLIAIKKFATSIIHDPINYYSDDPIIGIEDYAFGTGGRMTNSICQIAEATAIFKYTLFSNLNPKIRLYDPKSVKMFALGHGKSSDKKEIVEKVTEESNGKVIIPKDTYSTKKNGDFDGPGTDLADSYFIARLLWTEYMCRQGKIDYRELDAGKRRVFLRTTKAHPVNILDAPYGEWIN